MPSEQFAAAAQTPPRQMELRQSALMVQLPPALHLGHVGPPQSTPVSLPFLMPSEQFAAGEQAPARQIKLRQSLLVVQLLLAVHWGHDGPPQSTPVSLPFLMPSEHVAFCPAAQTMRVVVFVVLVPGFVTSMLTETQLELTQSLPAMHVEPAAHLGHVGPPQSTPVSFPFKTPSLQVAAGAAEQSSNPSS